MADFIKDGLKLKIKFILFYYLMLLISGVIASILLKPFSSPFVDGSIHPLFVSVIMLPLLIVALDLFCNEKSFKDKLRYLGLKKISLKVTFLVISGTVIFKLIEGLFVKYLDIQPEVSLGNLPILFQHYALSILLFVTISVVVPVYEEMLFRGWLVTKLIELKINDALIISLNASLFAVLHTQYEHIFSYLILLALGAGVCWLRLKTDNLSYSIISHSVFNFIALLALYSSFSH